METVDVCIYVFVKRVVCGSRTLYFDSVQFFPRIPPRHPEVYLFGLH